MPLTGRTLWPTVAAMALLRVQGLFKAFATIRAVDAVSFGVRPGEIYGRLGPNGTGKTPISMIAGRFKPVRPAKSAWPVRPTPTCPP